MSGRVRSGFFFLVLCVMGAFAILSSTMSKNPVLNPFAESLGTPEAFMGFVAAASTVPGVLIGLPAGSLSDVVGRRKMLLVSSFVFASAPFFYVLIGSWWQLVLVRFYHGFATAIFVPVMRATIAEAYPSRKGERISTFTSATILGRGVAPLLGGLILSVTVWNYQTLYLAVGIAGVTTLFIGLVLLKEQPRVETLRLPDKPMIQEAGPTHGWREVFGNFGIVVASSVEAAARYVYGALEFFLAGYLKNVANLDASLIGMIMSVQLVLIPIMNPFMGRLSDRLGRTIPILTGLVISGIPLMAIPYTMQFVPLVAISALYGLGFSMIISSTPALVGDLSSSEFYGASMGFLATVMDVGQMLGPIVTGFILAAFGYSGSFISLAAILLGFSIFFSIYQKSLVRKQIK